MLWVIQKVHTLPSHIGIIILNQVSGSFSVEG